jgi:hypothetical protein
MKKIFIIFALAFALTGMAAVTVVVHTDQAAAHSCGSANC